MRDAVRYGLGVWLVPFVVALAAAPARDDNRGFFESVMAVTTASVASVAAARFLQRHPGTGVGASLAIGTTWWAISVAIDLPLMLPEPVGMSPGEYAADIGLTYLMYPVITTVMGMVAGRRAGRGQPAT